MAVDAVAGGVSGSAVGGDAGLSEETLAVGDVLPVPPVADRRAITGGAAARARPADGDRAVSRPGAGDGPLRPRSVGDARVLCGGVPGGLAARRLFAEGSGLGVPAAERGAASGRRVPSVRGIDPEELPARRGAADRPCDAAVPAVLDTRRSGCDRGRVRERAQAGLPEDSGARERAEPSGGGRGGFGDGGAGDPGGAGAVRGGELPAALFREEQGGRVQAAGGVSGAVAGIVDDARSADDCGVLDGGGYRGPAQGGGDRRRGCAGAVAVAVGGEAEDARRAVLGGT